MFKLKRLEIFGLFFCLLLFFGQSVRGDNSSNFIAWQKGVNGTTTYGHLFFYAFTNNTSATLYGTQVSNVQMDLPANFISQNNFVNAGTLGGQPWNPMNDFNTYYFYVTCSSSVIWEADEDIYNSDYNADTWLTSTNGTDAGTMFFTHLFSDVDQPANNNNGEAVAVVNNNAFDVTVNWDKWNGAGWTNLSANNVVTAGGIWMTSGTVGGTGTVLADENDFRLTASANVSVLKGWLGNGGADDWWTVSPDLVTGLKYGTNLVGVISSGPGLNFSLSAPAGGPSVNYQIFEYVPSGAYPNNNFMVGNTNAGSWIIPTTLVGNAGNIPAGTSVILNGVSANDGANGYGVNFYKVTASSAMQAVMGCSISSGYGSIDWLDSSDNAPNFIPLGNNFIFSFQNVTPSTSNYKYITSFMPNPGTTGTLTITNINGTPCNGLVSYDNSSPSVFTGVIPGQPVQTWSQTSTVPNEPLVWQFYGCAAQQQYTVKFSVTGGTGTCAFDPDGCADANWFPNNAWRMSGMVPPVLTNTSTSTPTSSPTPGPTGTFTATATITNTPSQTGTSTNTPTITTTATDTVTGSSTQTSSATLTPSPTLTSSQTVTPSLTSTPSATSTPVPPIYIYPNIFNPDKGEKVKFWGIPAGSKVVIYDLSTEFVWRSALSGSNDLTIVWDGRNMQGNLVAQGIYFYILEMWDSPAHNLINKKTGHIGVLREGGWNDQMR